MGGGWGRAAATLLLVGCASTGGVQDGVGQRSTAQLEEGAEVLAVARFVDPQTGFEISRPDGAHWQFAPGHEAPEGILVPVVVLHPATGTQVVVQITPDIATPTEFAERLAVGLRSKPGFSTTVPIAVGDGSVSGFNFALGDEVQGKVGILDARDGRLFVLLATWPSTAPRELVLEVDAIMGSLRPFRVGHAAR